MQTITEPNTRRNGGAYETTETRTGLPLTYVADNFRSALLDVHALYAATKDSNPEYVGAMVKCKGAFRSALKAYLALINVLEIANERDIFENLLEMPHSAFKKWVNRTERKGSVT